MNVYDTRVDDWRFGLAVYNGEIAYVCIAGLNIPAHTFEEMYRRYNDFDVEAASERDESNA